VSFPTTFIGHFFWTESWTGALTMSTTSILQPAPAADDTGQAPQRRHFLKQAGV
jgi:hypothetical protein